MAKPRRDPGKITNRRAKFDYQLGDEFVVGLVLSGRETKALRLHHGQLTGAYVTDKDNELWLINAQIMGSSAVPIAEDEITQSRKLLAKRSEINKIIAARRDGLSAVPMEILTKGRYIKLRIALGKGKRQYDKRQTLKKKQMERDAKRVVS